MKKRLFVFLLCVVMVFSTMLTACGNKSEKNDGDSEKGGQTESQNDKSANKDQGIKLSRPGEFPIVEDKVTLTVLTVANTAVEDFSTNEFTKWYEEKTNVHVEFEVMPAKNYQDKLNLLLAGGDYPEVMMDCGVTQSQIMSYASQGVFVPIEKYIEKQAVELTKLFEQEDYRYVKDTITYPDGHMYAMPDLNQCYHCSMAQKLWINRTWLDKLGLDMPKTIYEFADVLRAFRDNDPNGNGKQDEIPFAACKQGWFGRIPGFLMNSFIYSDSGIGSNTGRKDMIIKDGKIDVTYNKTEWKEGLLYLHGLYEEGLIYPETFTQEASQLQQLGENPDTVILGASVGGHQGEFTQLYGESGRWLEYDAVPPLEGPDGRKPTCYYNPYMVSPNTLITDKCKNPELVVKWIDGMYETESVLRSNFGRPDIEWRWAKEGEKGLNGKPAIYDALVEFTETVQNINWMQTGPQVRTSEFRLGRVNKENSGPQLETILYEATKKYEKFRPDYTEMLPKLVFNEEQSNELADLEKSIRDYVETMTSRFIIGDVDIEAEWDNYLKTLDDMRLDRYIEIYQEAYDYRIGK